jgi:hypothetical protein
MVAGIAQKRFSVTEFHKMVEAGILREDDRLELVQGLIVEMPRSARDTPQARIGLLSYLSSNFSQCR